MGKSFLNSSCIGSIFRHTRAKLFLVTIVIIEHVPQAIERTGKGLLGNSEQVVEATHAKFEKFWSKYLVVDLESDVHGERLL